MHKIPTSYALDFLTSTNTLKVIGSMALILDGKQVCTEVAIYVTWSVEGIWLDLE